VLKFKTEKTQMPFCQFSTFFATSLDISSSIVNFIIMTKVTIYNVVLLTMLAGQKIGKGIGIILRDNK